MDILGNSIARLGKATKGALEENRDCEKGMDSFIEDLKSGKDIIRRTASSASFEWDHGSALIFWR